MISAPSLGWVAGALWALAGGTPAAARCDPAVRVMIEDAAGPAADVGAAVVALLAERGVRSTAPPGCPRVDVRLAAAGEGLRIERMDLDAQVLDSPDKNPSSDLAREVPDAPAAATLIESWARADIDAPLLAPRPGLNPPVADQRAGQPTSNRTLTLDRPLFLAGGGLHTGWGRDGSVWLEPEVGGCVMLGGVCTGVLARGRLDLAAAGDSVRLDTDRKGVDVLLTAEYPIALSWGGLSPGLGVGAGWLRSSFKGDEVGASGVEVDAGGVRLEARLAIQLPVGRAVALELVLRGNLAPLAHDGSIEEEGLTLAGEPSWGVGAGLGARVGGP